MYNLCEEFDGALLPRALTERYRVADGPAIKVALFLLGTGSGDVESVADALSLPIETVERALIFWKSAGLITDEVKKKEPIKKTVQEEKPRVALTDSRKNEMLRNPEIAVLLQETQHFLGRPLSLAESNILLEIFEYEQLPVDVILMIIAFCVTRAKSKSSLLNFVQRTASIWREQGIDDAESAEEHIKLSERRERRERKVAKVLELDNAKFTVSQREHIARWFEEMGYTIEFVTEAYMRTGKNSVAYINGVLKNWHQQGYKTIKDTRAVPSNSPAPVKKKKSSESSLLKKAVEKRNKARATHGVQ